MTKNNTHTVIERIYHDDLPDLSDLEYMLNLSNRDDIQLLYDFADNVRKIYCGDGILVRGIIEFSSYCKNTCMYCGLNKYNRNLPRYRLSKTEIMDCVGQVVSAGIKTVVLQSGQDILQMRRQRILAKLTSIWWFYQRKESPEKSTGKRVAPLESWCEPFPNLS